MIMIHIERTDNMAIRLIFDQVGLAELLYAFQIALNGRQGEVTAKLDTAVIKMKQGSGVVSTSICIELGETSLFSAYDRVNKWTIERESLESAIESLEKCQACGYFSPPEFMRVQVRKNQRLDYIYCELVPVDPVPVDP
jgi:hypothetical protein